ncbi:hypothetical protein, partial [Frankia sp. CiP3]|uniref:hypothetical protein n=1 Tax=Frankia sp. CiP3 TaxID=2880971 RepID=UPI001EF40885
MSADRSARRGELTANGRTIPPAGSIDHPHGPSLTLMSTKHLITPFPDVLDPKAPAEWSALEVHPGPAGARRRLASLS